MDTSKEYIKMSDCPEIQGNVPFCEHYLNLFAYKRYNKIIGISPMITGGHLYRGHPVWLPSQSQLQGMVDWEKLKIHSQMEYFNNFKNIYCKEMNWSLITFSEMFPTWCRVWLAFVMWELHQKKWNGERWE